jgi:hypothetical protein
VRRANARLRARARAELQRSQIDHETVIHVALQHALIRFVDLVDLDELNVAGDPAAGTEIERP